MGGEWHYCNCYYWEEGRKGPTWPHNAHSLHSIIHSFSDSNIDSIHPVLHTVQCPIHFIHHHHHHYEAAGRRVGRLGWWAGAFLSVSSLCLPPSPSSRFPPSLFLTFPYTLLRREAGTLYCSVLYLLFSRRPISACACLLLDAASLSLFLFPPPLCRPLPSSLTLPPFRCLLFLSFSLFSCATERKQTCTAAVADNSVICRI